MKTALAIENISAGYDPGVEVLKNINLRVECGEFVGILGPNGAGKTTLFRVLTGLMRVRCGRIRIFEDARAVYSARKRASFVGVAPQELEAPIPFTVRELVTMSRTAWRTRWWRPQLSRADRHAVEKALTLTDLSELCLRPLHALSGGEKQRAIIAMAIAREPPLLLLDEATSHLDMNHRLEIMQIVERLNREHETTVLMISHDINLSADFCGRLLLLDHGVIVADGVPREVLRHDLLKAVYHCEVSVHNDPRRGAVTVNPARRLPSLPPGGGMRCHIIAGGGSAAELMRRLSLSGYRLSCGVLNDGDTDALTAEALDIPLTTEKPFSPVSSRTLAAARRQAGDCRLCIVSEVPFGPGNADNLAIAEDIQQRGGTVLIMRGAEQRDYTPDKTATVRVKDMLDAGAQTWENIPDLIQHLLRGKGENSP